MLNEKKPQNQGRRQALARKGHAPYRLQNSSKATKGLPLTIRPVKHARNSALWKVTAYVPAQFVHKELVADTAVSPARRVNFVASNFLDQHEQTVHSV